MRRKYFLFFVFILFFNKPAESASIHVFGDSHSWEFTQIPLCAVHWLGPITMHRVGRDGLGFLRIPDYGLQEGDAAVFAFGEIDCRCHIRRQCDLTQDSLDGVIDTLASNYIHTIVQNRALFNKLLCIVYSVTPPSDAAYNAEYPFYGTLEDRIMISKKLNKKLALLCKQEKIEFLNVYRNYANPNGSLITAISDGGVHIDSKNNIPIMKKLNRILERNKRNKILINSD